MKKQKRYFEYIDGESKGKVVLLTGVFEEGGELFYEFNDGETVNKQFISPMTSKKSALDKKFMVEVKSNLNEDLWRFDEVKSTVVDMGNMEHQTAPPLDDILAIDTTQEKDENGSYTIKSSLGKKKLRFPVNLPTTFQELPGVDWFDEEEAKSVKKEEPVRVIETDNSTETKQEAPQQQGDAYVEEDIIITPSNPSAPTVSYPPVVEHVSPEQQAVSILVSSAKKHETEIPIQVTMSLPSKSIYDIVVSEYDNGGDLFLNEIVKSITHDDIVKAIREGLKLAYTNQQES